MTETLFATPTKELFDMWMGGMIQPNLYVGGSMDIEIDASAAGTYDLRPWLPWRVDNRNNKITGFADSNGATLKVQVRYFVLVSQSSITATPSVYNITLGGNASYGAQPPVGCTASAEDFSGANQQQTIDLALRSNQADYYKPQVTISGSPAAGLRCRALAIFDCYVLMP